VAGINAYIAETRRNPSLLTPEFKMAGIKPGDWTPAIVISRFNGLAGNIVQELNMALAIRAIGVENVKDLEHFQPSDPNLTIDPAIDSSLLTKDILDLYRGFRTPFRFTAGEPAAGIRASHLVARLDDSPIPTPSALDLSQRR